MTTQTFRKDENLLSQIQEVAVNYGVKDAVVYPCSQLIEINYEIIGQGSALSDLISDKMGEIAPNRDYRYKMIPSDKKLLVELL